MSEELKQIKKIYGEEMMHLCRELFPTILENEGLLLGILTKNIAPTRTLAEFIKTRNYEDEFKSWVYSFIHNKIVREIRTGKTPYELMDEAGYILYECKSEEDIQSFKHYYANGEALCTFNGGRLNRCIVFFAVKKNVDEIKREDFKIPRREDEYGTSVISIQFSRGSFCTLSIKNRYNHTVLNPDSTFSNNLDNIIPGLTKSFEEECGITLQQNRTEEDFLSYFAFIKANDGKHYYYNIEHNAVYYCENNIIIRDGIIIDTFAKNKEQYVLADQYLFDLKSKTVSVPFGSDDSFINSINEVGEIKNIETVKNGNSRFIIITYEDDKKVKVEINKNSSIIGYENNYVKTIGHSFLTNNLNVKRVELREVTTIDNRFLYNGYWVKEVILPKVETIGDSFLRLNYELTELSLPEVKTVGNDFLRQGDSVKSVYLPKLETIGSNFLYSNKKLEELSLPSVKIIGDGFLRDNMELKKISLPNVESVGDDFLYFNSELEELSLPNLKRVGEAFMYFDGSLKHVFLPKLEIVGSKFMVRIRQKQNEIEDDLNNINADLGDVPEYRRPRT